LDQFDNELAFKVKGSRLKGTLRRQDHTGPATPVTAEKDKNYRFSDKNIAAARDFSGKYEVEFSFESGKKEKAVAVFKQDGNKLTGTFLKPSGDARYLQGIVEGNKFYLSSFIGSSPGYYYGTIDNDGKINGAQLGTKIKNNFSGAYNENADINDPYAVSKLKQGYSTLDFSLPDVNGKSVSLKDEKYKNKVVIIAITGTWCPNCIDEANFLSPWYKKNKDRGVEIITIHYERQTDTAFVNKVMRRFRQRFDITYDQVFGGLADNESVSKSLPALQGFSSFPTTIFVDKKGAVSKIHTGYTGPATGKFYDEFVKEFNDEVDKLLAQ
jgi:peroxiredoxin